jgi:hypothetical protein
MLALSRPVEVLARQVLALRCVPPSDLRVWSCLAGASDQLMTVGAQSTVEDRAVMVESVGTRGWPGATGRGAARPVSSTGASDRPKNCPMKGPTAIFVRGAINTCVGRRWLLLSTLGT